MTLDEANKLLSIVKVNYGYAFKNLSNQEKVLMVQSWAFVLQDIPADIVTLAFMQLVATHKWIPTPAEIREQVRKLYFDANTCRIQRQMDLQSQKTVNYILDNVNHLRSEYNEELSLGQILQRGYGKTLGTGKQEFQIQEKTNG